jgi:hypothetical protein
MINGINLNDPAQNQITFQPSISNISEFRWTTRRSAPGRPQPGAIVNITTRSGANVFHGEAFEFFATTRRFEGFHVEPAPKSPFQRNQ